MNRPRHPKETFEDYRTTQNIHEKALKARLKGRLAWDPRVQGPAAKLQKGGQYVTLKTKKDIEKFKRERLTNQINVL